jgi:hypothetical protein
MQNFFTFMSGYVNSSCFKSLLSRELLLKFNYKKMSMFSKLFYSIRNCNRFLISPMFVKMLWDDCSKFKFAGFYNFNLIFFVLGALGDLFNILFCLGEHLAVIFKVLVKLFSLKYTGISNILIILCIFQTQHGLFPLFFIF